MNDTNEQMILSFDSLIKGKATVSIAFDYSLRPGLEGLYRSQITGTATVEGSPATASPLLKHQTRPAIGRQAGHKGQFEIMPGLGAIPSYHEHVDIIVM